MDHWCQIPRLENFSYDQQRYIAIPYDSDIDAETDSEDEEETYSRCYAFDLPYDNYTDQQLWNWNRSRDVPEDTTVVYCQSWVYEQSEFIETAVSKVRI